MEAYIHRVREALLGLFPVRKTGVQKWEFRQWLLAELKHAGWKAREETYGKLNGSVNVVAGDADKATVFLVAHYDTPSRMLLPNFVSPTNPLAHILYHLVMGALLVVAALVLSFAVSFPLNQPELMLPLFFVLAIALLFLAAFGPANRHNANGNTSGVLALLAMARELEKDKRVCFVFLDNNERNLLGAAAFKKHHLPQADGCLFLNFDCVGDGETMLMMPSKLCRWDEELLSALEEGFRPLEGVTPRLLTQGLLYYPSDHRKFKFHVAFAACRRLSGLGYYISRLRTGRDTVLSLENIQCLSEGMARFLPLYFASTGKKA